MSGLLMSLLTCIRRCRLQKQVDNQRQKCIVMVLSGVPQQQKQQDDNHILSVEALWKQPTEEVLHHPVAAIYRRCGRRGRRWGHCLLIRFRRRILPLRCVSASSVLGCILYLAALERPIRLWDVAVVHTSYLPAPGFNPHAPTTSEAMPAIFAARMARSSFCSFVPLR